MQRLTILGDMGERTILHDWTKQGKVWLASWHFSHRKQHAQDDIASEFSMPAAIYLLLAPGRLFLLLD